MSLRWTYRLNPDRFRCKERGCEAHNDRIYIDFKHKPSTLNNLGRGIISEFNLKGWLTCCCNDLILTFFNSITFHDLSFLISSAVVFIYVVDDNFMLINTMFFVRFIA